MPQTLPIQAANNVPSEQLFWLWHALGMPSEHTLVVVVWSCILVGPLPVCCALQTLLRQEQDRLLSIQAFFGDFQRHCGGKQTNFAQFCVVWGFCHSNLSIPRQPNLIVDDGWRLHTVSQNKTTGMPPNGSGWRRCFRSNISDILSVVSLDRTVGRGCRGWWMNKRTMAGEQEVCSPNFVLHCVAGVVSV